MPFDPRRRMPDIKPDVTVVQPESAGAWAAASPDEVQPLRGKDALSLFMHLPSALDAR